MKMSKEAAEMFAKEIGSATKTVIDRRYYPTYYGRLNTYRSYRSVYVGSARKGSADCIIGYCDDSVADGWVAGPRGNPIRNRKLNLPGLVLVQSGTL